MFMSMREGTGSVRSPRLSTDLRLRRTPSLRANACMSRLGGKGCNGGAKAGDKCKRMFSEGLAEALLSASTEQCFSESGKGGVECLARRLCARVGCRMEAVEKSQYRVAGCRDTLLIGGSGLVIKMVHWLLSRSPSCLPEQTAATPGAPWIAGG